jgi:hypothetical protein
MAQIKCALLYWCVSMCPDSVSVVLIWPYSQEVVLFLHRLFNTEPVLPFQTTTDAPLLLRPRGPGDVKQSYN